MIKTITKTKNVLCFYQGGGYDGCMWEWNFFAFDKKGKFHNLYTSGRHGIKTVEQAAAIMDKEHPEHDTFSDPVYIYDLTNPEHVADFQSSHAVPSVVAIVTKLNDGSYGDYDGELYYECDKCGCKCSGAESIEYCTAEWHGCGGIASTADIKLCNDCVSLTHCKYCGEYDSDCEKYGGYCEYHYREAIEKAVNDIELQRIEHDSFENRFKLSSEPLDIDTDTDYWYLCADVSGTFSYQHYVVEAETEQAALDALFSTVKYLAIVDSKSMNEFISDIL